MLCGNINMGTYDEIRKEINNIKVIDSQECINTDIQYDLENKDVFCVYILHYLINDLISSGMVGESIINSIADSKVPAETRFKLALPYLRACTNTGYFRALKRSLKELHGIEDLNVDSLLKLQHEYLRCKDKEYVYNILHNKCNIESVMLDVTGSSELTDLDKRLFHKVWHPEKYIKPGPVSGEVIRWVERHHAPITSLDDWVSAFDEELTDMMGRGISALKISLGNFRSLYFEDVPYVEAKKAFNDVLMQWKDDGAGERDHVEFPKKLQDFMMHRVLSSLRGRGIVTQFDAGIQRDNKNMLKNTSPENLNNLIEHYQDVKFDILAIGWPYWRELVALAKIYPNVIINFAGSHVISTVSSIKCLMESIDTVPMNKIVGFGGNYLFVDGIYGQLEIAKDNIARALSELVRYGVFDTLGAIKAAEDILYTNPKRIYKL